MATLRSGNEINDVMGNIRINNFASGAFDDFEGLRPGHALEAEAIGQERRHAVAPGIEVGEKILAEADNELYGLALDGESLRLIGVRFEVRAHGIGGAMLEERFQLRGKLSDAAGSVGAGLAKSKDFLKLIEDDDRRVEAVSRAPEINVASMKILPQRFARAGPWRSDLGAIQFLDKGKLDLVSERRSFLAEIEAHPKRQEIQIPERRKNAGLNEGSLAKAGLAIKNDDGFALDEADEGGGLALTAKEEFAVGFSECA
jgi:hypothetical protein